MAMSVRTNTRGEAGKCACAEGYVAVYNKNDSGEDIGISHFEPTGLNVHDCAYIQVRNSKIKAAEKLSRQINVPFLTCMDYLMGRLPSDLVAYASNNGFYTTPK